MSQRIDPLPHRRTILAALAGIGACGMQLPALAADRQGSPWARGLHSRMRLVAAGRVSADGPHVAVVEIGLDKGFKTYWRTPGDSGIPPVFDFAGSDNAADIVVHFPAPLRFDDGAGGHSIGYVTPLVELPITYRPIDPAKPVRLKVKLDYAVCEKICVPASGQAELLLTHKVAASADAARLVATLPVKRAMGAKEILSVRALTKSDKAEHFTVEVSTPKGETPDLFVEGDNPWLFDHTAVVATGPGEVRFTVMAIDRDKTPDCKGVDVTLTLVSGGKAIETRTWLDVSLLSP